jgi:hypothetical protein
VINQIEGAIYSDTSKHITFWNIRQAFDSIPRKGVAEWFMHLDKGGLSFLDTPLYANTSALHSHKDMLKEKTHV